MRIIFAEGPRNAINAMTLYSVMQLNLLPNGKHAASDGHTPIAQFFYNLQVLANSDKEQAAILFGMLFSLIIWVISALGLIAACLIYITFLWHHIPSIDGGLSGFCKRKIDSRLQKIVGVKIKKALAKGDRAALNKESRNGERSTPIKRQPTIPLLTTEGDEKLPPMLSRQTTQATLPSYRSTPNGDPVPNFSRQTTLSKIPREPLRPAYPSRSETQSSAFSTMSYASDAPLVDAAMPMGDVPPRRSYSPILPSRINSSISTSDGRPMIGRSEIDAPHASQRPLYDSPYGSSIGHRIPGPPIRQNTSTSDYFTGAHSTSPTSVQGRRTPFQQVSPVDTFGRHRSEWGMDGQTSTQEYEMHVQSSSRNKNQYQAYNPNMENASTGQTEIHRSIPTSSFRNFTAPNRQSPNDYHPPQPPPPRRSGTAPLPQTARYANPAQLPYEIKTTASMSRPAIPPRAATTTPGMSAWNRNPNALREYVPKAGRYGPR